MKTKSIYIFGLFLILVCATYTFWIHQQYGLFKPQLNANDSNFYYLIGAIQSFDGSAMVRFGHPGLFYMNLLAWFLIPLKALGLINTFTLKQMQASPDPAGDLLHIFVWGKIISFILLTLLISVLTGIVHRLTNCKWIAFITGSLLFFQVGLFESIAIIRPEITSALALALIAWISLLWWGKNEIWRILLLFFLTGFCVGLAVSAKIIAIIYTPLTFILFWHFNPAPHATTRKSYLLSAIFLALLFALSLTVLTAGFNPSEFTAVIPTQLIPTVTKLWHLITVTLLPLVFICITLIAVLGGILKQQTCKLVFLIRRFSLTLLSVGCGIICSLYTATISMAQDKLAWGQKLVYTAWGQTLFDTFIRHRYDNNGNHSIVDFIFNQDILFLAQHFTLLLAVLVLGILTSRGKDRKIIIAAAILIWLISLLTSRRGPNVTFYYQIYLILPAVWILALGAKNIFLKISCHMKAGTILILAFFFIHDVRAIQSFRTHFFTEQRSGASEMAVLDYWGWGTFFSLVFKEKYCNNSDTLEFCYQKTGHILEEAVTRKNSEGFQIRGLKP